MMIGWCAGDDRDDGQTSARRRHPSGDHWPWLDIVVVVSPSGREEEAYCMNERYNNMGGMLLVKSMKKQYFLARAREYCTYSSLWYCVTPPVRQLHSTAGPLT